jgi:hypothetical protein
LRKSRPPAPVIIPGGQALLGFQLIATLTKAFSELRVMFKYVHCAELCAVALSVVLLMTPAAVHRIVFDGEDHPAFFRIGSSLVIAGAIPLAVGIAADVAVVFFKATESTDVAVAAGAGALALLLVFWLAGLASQLRYSSFLNPLARTPQVHFCLSGSGPTDSRPPTNILDRLVALGFQR